jgi:hypothetical protein
MSIELFGYNVSILNPILKIVVILGFFIAAIILYQCRKKYGGILKKISVLLFMGSLASVFASIFRFLGDFYLQFKWGESIFNLILVLITLIVVIIVRKQIDDIVFLFKNDEEDI